jgi:hypothetical protein
MFKSDYGTAIAEKIVKIAIYISKDKAPWAKLCESILPLPGLYII